MKVGYYPGCSLHGTAKDYEQSIKAVCNMLSIELHEIEDWNCCGASAAHSINSRAGVGLPARNLEIAGKSHKDILVPCPLCFNRLKTAQKELQKTKDEFDFSIPEDLKVWDLADFLSQDSMMDEIKKRVKVSLNGLKVVCYYGCMTSRPPKVTDSKRWEDPLSMDRIVECLGGEPIQWSYKTDCCGASHLVPRPELVHELVGRLYREAKRAGAECIVVSCQMCQANLDMPQDTIMRKLKLDWRVPIVYFTELMGLSMGHRDVEKWFKKHFIDPRKADGVKSLLFTISS